MAAPASPDGGGMERCYGVLCGIHAAHMKGVAGVRFVTARDMQEILTRRPPRLT